MPDVVLLVAVLVHALLCLVLLVLARRGVLLAPPSSVAMAFFVPVFGPVGVALLEARLRDEGAVGEEFDIEELRVNDAVHRSILMEQSTVGSVVPLRDALLINDPATRREIIMDVLYDDASSQAHALRVARGNDDAEVVHYATTALVELQKTYDDRMARARRACERSPHDAHATGKLAEVLGDYIASGLLEGSMLASVRAEYARVLEGLFSCLPQGSDSALGAAVRAFANASAQGDARAMDAWAARVEATWPQREEGHLMRLRCAVRDADRQGVDRALHRLADGGVRLSLRGRHEVAYWQAGGEEEA